MLTHLYIQNFTIIDTAEIELLDGMTTLTGETGAGKSILIDAIGLVLGDRGDAGLVREGTSRAEVAATFQPTGEAPIWSWLQQHDLDDGSHCLLRRVVTAEGKSRGYINNRPVSMQTLRTVGDMLVAIHGQHEHFALTQPATQRDLLDGTLTNPSLRSKVADAWHAWAGINQRLLDITEHNEQRQQRTDMLRFQLQEFESLSLQRNELDTIENEHSRLANGERLLELANGALSMLESVDAAADARLEAALKHLHQLEKLDTSLSECTEIVNSAAILTSEASATLRDYINDLEIDTDRLHWLDERLSQLHRLARKHQCDIPALGAVHERLQQALDDIDDDTHNLDRLQRDREELWTSYLAATTQLTQAREAAGATLSAAVTQAMQALGMQGGVFTCELTSSETRCGPDGCDTIRFQVSPNPGFAPADISRIASGGELSRISLAIALVTSQQEQTPTLIFDEVDSGIGGGVADTVGRYLRQLGKHTQVLCVTHLPQVAAQAHHHLKVSKEVVDARTRTSLASLQRTATIDEIARMVGGARITNKSRQHAREMLESVDD